MGPGAVGLCLAVGLLLRAGSASPIASLESSPPDEDSPLFDDVFSEQDGLDFDSLLLGVKKELLKALNLTDLPHPRAAKVEPPEYMLELYRKFAADRTSRPSANIVRSFKDEAPRPAGSPDGPRRYPLLFNLSIPRHEEVTLAELRLYGLVERDRRPPSAPARKVTVFEVQEAEAGDRKPAALAVAAEPSGTGGGWETFDVTEAVRRWGRSGPGARRLEVRVDGGPPGRAGGAPGPAAGHRPLLVVFSDDRGGERKEEREELEDMMEHERLLDLDGVGRGAFPQGPGEEALLQMRSNIIYDSTARIRRNAKGNYCKRVPLYVDFKEIGWDSWIIAPPGYDAFECRGHCSYPLAEHVTPTKHAIIQSLVHLKNPQKASKACCVPTKLDPISILYLDKGVVTYKFKYEGMAVAECGCR
ncbi:bone morphogenetic protein 10 [Ornithorhynchus anatinus]|uniref:Bone morphotic protein 10 n=1 Tax=Ornithorhynchus anatinus TaxID=9258 RepID=F7F846_ORNAN|nr:bone morphogenetic protein 10 [Ornithorhynchus anatinus]